MASKEKGNEGTKSFRRALFPENFKRILQHRYFSSQNYTDPSASVDTSMFDKTDPAGSIPASPSQESSFEELLGCSPSKSKYIETDTASTNTTEGSIVFMETPTKTPPQELSPQSTSNVSQMAFRQHDCIASLPSQRHVRLELSISLY
jgi:hypothetical protein